MIVKSPLPAPASATVAPEGRSNNPISWLASVSMSTARQAAEESRYSATTIITGVFEDLWIMIRRSSDIRRSDRVFVTLFKDW